MSRPTLTAGVLRLSFDGKRRKRKATQRKRRFQGLRALDRALFLKKEGQKLSFRSRIKVKPDLKFLGLPFFQER